jgi:hypothetical protein
MESQSTEILTQEGSEEWLDELLTQEQQAGEIKKSKPWLARSRGAGTGPRYIKIGRTPYYTRRFNRIWLESRTRTSSRSLPTAGRV